MAKAKAKMDFGGMKALIARMGLELQDKKVLILGTGGTSKTALAVARSLGAREVRKVSRSAFAFCLKNNTAVRREQTAFFFYVCKKKLSFSLE